MQTRGGRTDGGAVEAPRSAGGPTSCACSRAAAVTESIAIPQSRRRRKPQGPAPRRQRRPPLVSTIRQAKRGADRVEVGQRARHRRGPPLGRGPAGRRQCRGQTVLSTSARAPDATASSATISAGAATGICRRAGQSRAARVAAVRRRTPRSQRSPLHDAIST